MSRTIQIRDVPDEVHRTLRSRAAALGWGATLVRVCAGFTLMVFILMYQDQYGHQVQREWGGVAMVLPVLFILAAGVIAAGTSFAGSTR